MLSTHPLSLQAEFEYFSQHLHLWFPYLTRDRSPERLEALLELCRTLEFTPLRVALTSSILVAQHDVDIASVFTADDCPQHPLEYFALILLTMAPLTEAAYRAATVLPERIRADHLDLSPRELYGEMRYHFCRGQAFAQLGLMVEALPDFERCRALNRYLGDRGVDSYLNSLPSLADPTPEPERQGEFRLLMREAQAAGNLELERHTRHRLIEALCAFDDCEEAETVAGGFLDPLERQVMVCSVQALGHTDFEMATPPPSLNALPLVALALHTQTLRLMQRSSRMLEREKAEHYAIELLALKEPPLVATLTSSRIRASRVRALCEQGRDDDARDALKGLREAWQRSTSFYPARARILLGAVALDLAFRHGGELTHYPVPLALADLLEGLEQLRLEGGSDTWAVWLAYQYPEILMLSLMFGHSSTLRDARDRHILWVTPRGALYRGLKQKNLPKSILEQEMMLRYRGERKASDARSRHQMWMRTNNYPPIVWMLAVEEFCESFNLVPRRSL